MHPCKSFTDDLGGETYLDSGGKSPAENLPIIQYPLSIFYDYIMSNIHVERFLLMVPFSCREAARPPPRCWMPQRFTFAKEFFFLFREACFTTKSDIFGQRPNGGDWSFSIQKNILQASLESFNSLSNRYFPGCYNGDDVNEARVGDGHADH